MKPLKIMMVVDNLDIGGTETHALEIAKSLQLRGHKLIIGTNGGPFAQKFQQAGLQLVPMSFQRDNPIHTNYTDLLQQMRKTVIEHEIELIHVHLIAGLKIAHQISQEMLIPIVFTAHGMFYPWRQLQSLIDGCEHVIAVSHPVANWVRTRLGYPQKQTSIIPNGIDTTYFMPNEIKTNQFREELGVADSDFLITLVSRMAWGKTRIIENAIQAVQNLSEQYNVRLAIVGSGPDSPFIRALATMVNKRYSQDLILLTGALLDPINAYQESDLIIGTARVALEAMSCGKPVLAAGNSGYVGLITPDNFGKGWKLYFGDHDFVSFPNPTILEKELEQILINPSLLNETDQVRQLVTEYFYIENTVNQIEEVYAQVLDVTISSPKVGTRTIADLTTQTPATVHPEPELPPSELITTSETKPKLLTSPLVSIVIPTYNREKYLDDCLGALFKQTYRPLEIIVIDDHSTDNTDKVMDKWIKESQNVAEITLHYHKLPRNIGFAHAMSTGYFLAQGEFIANQDSDDISHPTRIENQVRFLLANQDYDMVGTNYEVFTTNINQTKKAYLLRYDNNIIKCYREGNHCVVFGSLMLRKKVIDKIGGLTTFMVGAEDYEYIARAIVQGFNVQNLRSVLYYYRKHQEQRSKEFYSLRSSLTAHAKEEA